MHVTKPNACSYRIGNLYFSRTVNLQLDIRIFFVVVEMLVTNITKKDDKKVHRVSVLKKNRMYSANEEQVLIAVSSIFFTTKRKFILSSENEFQISLIHRFSLERFQLNYQTHTRRKVNVSVVQPLWETI